MPMMEEKQKKNNPNGITLKKLADIVPLEMPLSLVVSSGNICNLKCNYCYHGSEKKKQDLLNGHYIARTLDKDIVDLIVKQSMQFDHQYEQASIVGCGEPLANRNIGYIIKELKRVAKRVKIISNATLLTNDLAMELIDAGLDTLKISLQGVSAKQYSEICGTKIDFEELVQRISYFYEHKRSCQVHIKTVDAALTSENEKKRFFEIFEKVSDKIWIENLIDVNDAGEWIDDKNRWQDFNKNVEVCYFPFYYIKVDENGYVYTCCHAVEGIKMGSIYQNTLSEIWRTEMQTLREAHLKLNKKAYNTCLQCKTISCMYREENDLDKERETILQRMYSRI